MAAGSCCRPRTPLAPGPAAIHAKTLAQLPFPGCYANTPGAHTQLRAPGTHGDLDSSCRAGRPAGAPSCLYLSAGCLGVRGAPPAGCALSPCLRRREQTAGAGSLSPAPRRQAPPPGSKPRPSTPAYNRREPSWPSGVFARACRGDEAAAAAPAATTAVFATAAEASSHRPKCPELSRGSPHNRG